MSPEDPNFGHADPSPSTQPAVEGRSQLPAIPEFAAPSTAVMHESGAAWLEEPETGEGIQFMGLLHSLRRRWLMAAGWGFGSSLLVAVVLWVLVPINHEAESYLRVRQVEEDIIGDRKTRQTDKAYEIYKQTQANLIKSPFAVMIALRQSGISQLSMVTAEDNAVEWLTDEISCMVSPESQIIRVSLKGEDKEEVIKLVDAVVDAYMQEFVAEERRDKLKRKEILEQVYMDLIKDSHRAQTEFNDLAKDSFALDTESAKAMLRFAMQELHDMRREKAMKEGLYRDAMRAMYTARAGFQASRLKPGKYAIEDMLITDPEYFEAKEFLRYSERELEDVARVARPGGRALAMKQAQIAAMQNRLDQMRGEKTPWAVDRIHRMQQVDEITGEAMISTLQTESAILKGEVEALDQRYNKTREEFERMNSVSVDLLAKQDELETRREHISEVKMERDKLDLNVKQLDRVKRIQKAFVPNESDWLFKILQVGGASSLVFILVVGGIALWDYQGKRVNTIKDVHSGGIGLRVVGSLPLLDGHGVGGLWPFGRLNQQALEVVLNFSVDSIRAALLYNRAHEKIKMVMVTSAIGQEGKSTLASQLAVSLARSGRRTVLLDADVRNPQQHLVFGVNGGRGFCELLRQAVGLDHAVQPTAVERLWVIPSGRYDQASMQALSGDSARRIFGELKSQYDFVVIDVGPVLTSADPMLVGQHVDTTLLSVRRDVSQIPKVYDACDRLRSVGVHIMGAVVNGTGTEIRANEVDVASNVAALPEPEMEPTAG